ncbi:transcription initiation factor TFIID subunit 11 [Coemansia sp. RSA 2320]|nr:transcription initiation factor TFIID subunit 11 [Coemansia sp. RSA 2320]
MSRTAGGEAELDDGDDDLVPIEHHRPADGAADDEDDDEAQADRSGAAGANVGGEAPSLDEDTLHLIKQSKEEIKELWDQMSEEQRQRFDVYRRTALNKASMKKLVTGVLNQQISSTLTFVVAGFSKVFVGQIVERAVQVQSERGEDGPLKPEHLREAYRLYKKENQSMSGGSSSSSGFTKRMF